MKRLAFTLSFIISAIFITGCAGDYQSSGSGRSYSGPSSGPDQSTATAEQSNSAQEAIDRDNAQAASNAAQAAQAANDAAQAANNAAQAAAQETENNANNAAPPN